MKRRTDPAMLALTCYGKRQYLTFEHARHDAKHIRDRTSDSIQEYHCRVCHSWHVGTGENDAKTRYNLKQRQRKHLQRQAQRARRRRWQDDDAD